MGSAFALHLARHLPTLPQATGLLDATQFAALLARDPARTVVPAACLGPGLVAAAAGSDRLLTSTLARAEETARVLQAALGPRCPPIEHWPELVEAGQPALAWPGVRLTDAAWSALSRVAWVLGVAETNESRAAAEARAVRVVDRFESLATPGRAITVIAHGCFNVLLARELRRRHWSGPRVPDVRAAHFSSYVRWG